MRHFFKITALLVLFIIAGHNNVDATASDTTKFRRPFYIGVSGIFMGYMNGFYAGSPVSTFPNGIPFGDERTYWTKSFGIMAGIPLGRKFELEIGLDRNLSRGWITEINEFHPDPNFPGGGTIDW